MGDPSQTGLVDAFNEVTARLTALQSEKARYEGMQSENQRSLSRVETSIRELGIEPGNLEIAIEKLQQNINNLEANIKAELEKLYVGLNINPE